MKFTIDTEFNGFGGELLSLALVPWDENSPALYLRVPEHHYPFEGGLDPWVQKNVWPYMDDIPLHVFKSNYAIISPVQCWGKEIADYFKTEWDGGMLPYVIADWPDDIRHLCSVVITGPGQMVDIARLQFDVVRVDPYEASSAPAEAVRHNAYWDAVALRDHLKKFSTAA